MKKNPNNNAINDKVVKNGTTNGYLPNSFKFLSSCIKTVSSNVRLAGASVASSISADSSSDNHYKDQVIWACFDKLELNPGLVKRVLLLGYTNGFQVIDVEDSSSVCELISRRDNDPVTFLQMQPIPTKSDSNEGFIKSHPILLVVAIDSNTTQNGFLEPQASPTTLRFYSLTSHNYVHILRFRSTIYMVRSSPQIVAIGLATQIYCVDALTLENKFSVLTYPVPQVLTGVNIGYGPMSVGTRWLAYASNNPLVSNTGKLSPQSLSPSPGVSPSTSPSSGNLVARYAMESSKHLASGLINLGDMGIKSLSKNNSWKVPRPVGHSIDTDSAGMVVIKDFISKAIVSQFRAHTSPISALCFDPSGTLLVTVSTHGSNINIFRIMPCNDWSVSHVHLYKLHRGITSAVIQDICFSDYSQWISIVTSRGTCHVFVLSPFGGETGLHLINSHAHGLKLLPVLSSPWWFTNHHSTTTQPPPMTVTLSVVSRIHNGNSNWLNTATSGKITNIPSGVVSAVFHSCIRSQNSNLLEHLLVYSPSGHLVQYELVPSSGVESGESSLTNRSSALEDDLRVKVDPVQWWDVCRRADWPEREEDCINSPSISSSEDIKPLSYISNAEVQSRSAKVPIWQKSKVQIYLYTMNVNVNEDFTDGEIEMEKISVSEIEVKRKDLLPVVDNFHKIRPVWVDERKHVNVTRLSETKSFGSREKLQSAGNLTMKDGLRSSSLRSSLIQGALPLARVSSSAPIESSSIRFIDEGLVNNNNPIGGGFEQYFQEGYCKAASNSGESHDKEDVESDDLLGGVFAFSEEN